MGAANAAVGGAAWADVSLLDPRIIGLTAALAGVLLVGAIVLAWADRWRKRQLSEPGPAEQLGSFRAMYERGELSKEEYERIRRRVAARTQNRPAAPPAEEPASPPEISDRPPA